MNEGSPVVKRSRGRPVGTGIDDTATLAMVADRLHARPGMSAAAAMKQSVKGIRPSHLRRLHDKWRKSRERLLVEAEERARQKAEAKSDPVSAAYFGRGGTTLSRVLSMAVDHASARLALQEVTESISMKARRLGWDVGVESIASRFARDGEDFSGLARRREVLDRLDPLARYRHGSLRLVGDNGNG